MSFCEGVTGTSFQVSLEPLSQIEGLKRHVELEFPRSVFGGVRTLAGVVLGLARFEVPRVASVEFSDT